LYEGLRRVDMGTGKAETWKRIRERWVIGIKVRGNRRLRTFIILYVSVTNRHKRVSPARAIYLFLSVGEFIRDSKRVQVP
jgi:hypothetical protein